METVVFGNEQGPFKIPISYPYSEEVRSPEEVRRWRLEQGRPATPNPEENVDWAESSPTPPATTPETIDVDEEEEPELEEDEELVEDILDDVGEAEFQLVSKSRWAGKHVKTKEKKIKSWKFCNLPSLENPTEIAYIDMEFFEFSGFTRQCKGGDRAVQQVNYRKEDGTYFDAEGNPHLREEMCGSTLDYLRDHWPIAEANTGFTFEDLVGLATWCTKGKCPRLMAKTPREISLAMRSKDGKRVHFMVLELLPLIDSRVLFNRYDETKRILNRVTSELTVFLKGTCITSLITR